ncbi:MAG: 3'-5' exonuclease [Deltaproteobacteria bacterium]|nr:3'-5' exonuclease [Deltaproteobacteria bacterium]
MDDARLVDLPIAVIDCETTGLDPKVDRIIEVAIIHMQGGVVLDRWSSLVDPEQVVSEEVIKITGIDPQALAVAPRFSALAAEVHARLSDRVFIAYNLAFDRAFLTQELERAGRELPARTFLDPLVFVRELHKSETSKRLTAIAAKLGVPLSNAHRAADDAEAAGHVLFKLLERLPDRLGDLLLLQQQWEAQQRNEMATWKGDRGAFEGVGGFVDRGNALGPAYVYGDDTDPVRAMFVHLPDAGAARRTA